jgi:hypothetical protein
VDYLASRLEVVAITVAVVDVLIELKGMRYLISAMVAVTTETPPPMTGTSQGGIRPTYLSLDQDW